MKQAQMKSKRPAQFANKRGYFFGEVATAFLGNMAKVVAALLAGTLFGFGLAALLSFAVLSLIPGELTASEASQIRLGPLLSVCVVLGLVIALAVLGWHEAKRAGAADRKYGSIGLYGSHTNEVAAVSYAAAALVAEREGALKVSTVLPNRLAHRDGSWDATVDSTDPAQVTVLRLRVQTAQLVALASRYDPVRIGPATKTEHAVMVTQAAARWHELQWAQALEMAQVHLRQLAAAGQPAQTCPHELVSASMVDARAVLAQIPDYVLDHLADELERTGRVDEVDIAAAYDAAAPVSARGGSTAMPWQREVRS